MALYYSELVAKKTFRGVTVKDAYMKAVKWYATNVISKSDLQDMQVQYIKGKNEPTVTIAMYATLPEAEVRRAHCQICEEVHHSFFINENNDCNRCAVAGYQRRLETKMSVKKGRYKELLKEK